MADRAVYRCFYLLCLIGGKKGINRDSSVFLLFALFFIFPYDYERNRTGNSAVITPHHFTVYLFNNDGRENHVRLFYVFWRYFNAAVAALFLDMRHHYQDIMCPS